MVGGMGTFIELRLTTGEKRHVETGESNAQTEIDRWAQREKTSWIETVEGIWVNPEHILEVRLVELQVHRGQASSLRPRLPRDGEGTRVPCQTRRHSHPHPHRLFQAPTRCRPPIPSLRLSRTLFRQTRSDRHRGTHPWR